MSSGSLSGKIALLPELPEVETIRMGLVKYLVGSTIEGVEVRLPKIVTGNR